MGYFSKIDKPVGASPSSQVTQFSSAGLPPSDDNALRSSGSYLTEALIARGSIRPLQAETLEAAKLKGDLNVIVNFKFARQAELS